MPSRAQSILQKLEDTKSGVHAVLLYGPRGAGKSELAKKLTIDWLGNDRARQAYERGANPDVHPINPVGPSRIIKLGQVVKVTPDEDNFFPLVDFLRTPPLYSEHKIAIINDADRMNDAATNALLKPLEEPAPYARLVLTTTTISKIRQTILSRCLVVACELPAEQDLINLQPAASRILIQLSEGAPGTLREMQENPEVFLPIATFADDLVVARPESTLAMSSKFKDIVDALDDKMKLGARASGARCLELLAIAITRRHPGHGHIVDSLLLAHKRIEGNAASGLVFDATFAQILVK